MPTLKYLIGRGARIVLGSHLGRPDGQVKPEYSLEPVAVRLAELLGQDIALADEPAGDGAPRSSSNLRDGQIGMLENLRFSPGEEANDDGLRTAARLYCDVYVNDAFGTAHREHASTAGWSSPSPTRAPGFLMARRSTCCRGCWRGRSAVRRRARRLEGQRQDRGARRPARARADDRDRRRDGEHVLCAQDKSDRQEQGARRKARGREELFAKGEHGEGRSAVADRRKITGTNLEDT